MVLNKALPGDDPSRQYCQAHGLPILAEIAFEVQLGKLTSNGMIAVKEDPRYRALFERLRTRHASADTLSMGMSADMEAAIAEGATMVRIGTALFGPRT